MQYSEKRWNRESYQVVFGCSTHSMITMLEIADKRLNRIGRLSIHLTSIQMSGSHHCSCDYTTAFFRSPSVLKQMNRQRERRVSGAKEYDGPPFNS